MGRFQSKPKIHVANPWMGELAIEMRRELFSFMANIIDRTQFGHQRSENNTTFIYDIVDMRKAKYLFMRMDLNGVQDVDHNTILEKRKKTGDVNPSERCEVVVSEGKPMKLKFHKSSEVLTLSFHYGYWTTWVFLSTSISSNCVFQLKRTHASYRLSAYWLVTKLL